MKPILHQWHMSPFCNKARRILRSKGIDFEVQNYNGLLARHAGKLSSQGTLPVLETDGQRIVDSTAIAQYLDEKFPEPRCYPADPAERAMACVWEDWAGQSLYYYEVYFRMLIPAPREKALDMICAGRPGWEKSVLRMIFKRRYPAKMRSQGLGKLPYAEVERQLFGHLANLDTLLAGRQFLVGSAPSIADHSVAAQVEELLNTSEVSDRIRAFKHLGGWLERLQPA